MNAWSNLTIRFSITEHREPSDVYKNPSLDWLTNQKLFSLLTKSWGNDMGNIGLTPHSCNRILNFSN